MIRAALDVNVLVSAVISPHGIPFRLILAWQAAQFTLVISEHIVSELTAKLALPRIRGRYRLADADVVGFETLLRDTADMIAVPGEAVTAVTDDPEDDAVLATARLGQAAYLVTGDRELLDLHTHDGVQIVSPRAFLTVLERDRDRADNMPSE